MGKVRVTIYVPKELDRRIEAHRGSTTLEKSPFYVELVNEGVKARYNGKNTKRP